MVASKVARVPERAFERVIQREPELVRAFGLQLVQQHSELLERLASAVQNSAMCRVSGAVDYLRRKLGQRCPLAEGTRIPLSQVEVAKVANHTRQTTNEVLAQLQAVGLVRVERSMICVLDLDGVASVAGGSDAVPVWEPAHACKFVSPDAVLTCYPLRRAKPASSQTK